MAGSVSNQLLPQKGALDFETKAPRRTLRGIKKVLGNYPDVSAPNLVNGPTLEETVATYGLAGRGWTWGNGRQLSDEELTANSSRLHEVLEQAASDINDELSAALAIHTKAAGLAVQLPRPDVGDRPTEPRGRFRKADKRAWRRQHQEWLVYATKAMAEATQDELAREDSMRLVDRQYRRLFEHLIRLDWPVTTRWAMASDEAGVELDVVVAVPETMRYPELAVERVDFALAIKTDGIQPEDVHLRAAFMSLSMAAAISVGLYLESDGLSLRITGILQDPGLDIPETDIGVHDGVILSARFFGPIWTSELIGSTVPSARSLLFDEYPGLTIFS